MDVDERVDEKTIFVETAKIAYDQGSSDYWKLNGTLDDKTCDNCKKWIGQIITMSGNDTRYKTYDQFVGDHVFHPNCRCSLTPVEVPKMTKKDLNNMAQNTESIRDTFLYTGFIDEELEDSCGVGTYDYGETLVMLSPMGEFKGYSDGSSVNEQINDYALDKMVEEYNLNPTERLLDVDHRSMRIPEERDTTAAGWIYDLIAVKNLGKMSGLYGKIKWTDVGRKLVESRQYRFISPVFSLDEEGHPIKLINAALTNRPAMTSINPILNTSPETTQNDISKEEIDMTKDEVIELIKTTIQEMNSVENSCGTEDKEVKNEDCDTVEDVVETVEVKEEPESKEESEKTEVVEVANEQAPETKEVVEEDTKEEVIKEEVLNTTPTLGMEIQDNSWKKLSGKAFWDYLKKHQKELM